MRARLIGAASLCVVSVVALSGPAVAGEVTGNGKTTPIRDKANSVCAFSGKEDGFTLTGFNEDGSPILVAVATGPGYVQTPHMENAAGVINPPGIPGFACRGGSN